MPRRLTLLLAALAALALPAAASAQDKLQPGAMVETEAGQCTLNFVFNGEGANAGKTYIGTAAHCVEKIGEPVTDINGDQFGKVAFIGNADDANTDYSFIEVLPEHLSRVDPSMKGHPEFPSGFTTEGETTEGDMLQLSGYGVGFGETQPTQEQRQAILQGDDAETYWFSGPSVNGDSGGPIVHIDSGKALGIISRYGFETFSTDFGPTIEGVLPKAAKAGFPVSLRLSGQPAPVATSQQQTPTTQPAPASTSQPAPATTPAKPAQSSRGKKTRRRKCKKTSRGNRGKKGTVRKCRAAKKKKSTRRH